MAQAALNKKVTVVLELTEDEALWLKYHSQNFPGNLEDELPTDKVIRHNIFTAIEDVLSK